MPEISIGPREDTSDVVKLNINGNLRIIKRETIATVTEDELILLKESHEGPYVYVFPAKKSNTVTAKDIEDINADTSSTIRSDIDNRGDEAGFRTDTKFG